MTEPFHADAPVSPDWLVVAQFIVWGVPKAQPRVKFASRGKFGKAYTPDGPHKAWEEMLFFQAKTHAPRSPYEGPVRVWLDLYFPRTSEYQKPCYPEHAIEYIQKPDRDNAEKKILDVFTNLGFFVDDKQVCGGAVNKWYVERGGKPRASVSIEVNQNWPYKRQKGGKSK